MLLQLWLMGAQSSQLSLSSVADSVYHQTQQCCHRAQLRLRTLRKPGEPKCSKEEHAKPISPKASSCLTESKVPRHPIKFLPSFVSCDRSKRSRSAVVPSQCRSTKETDSVECASVRSKKASVSSRRTLSTHNCYNPPNVSPDVIGQARNAVFKELANLHSRGTADATKLALGLNNELIRQVVHSAFLANEPLESAVSKLLKILNERVPFRRNVSGSSSVGILHIRCPKQHDHRIIAVFARKLTAFAEMYSAERAISLALLQIETAFKEDTKAVDLVVDFVNFACEGCGMEVVRKLVAELAQYKGFCERVFFVEFPEEYKGQCEGWKTLPREFRRKVWCVTEENLEYVLPDYFQRIVTPGQPSDECPTEAQICESKPLRNALKDACQQNIKDYFETSDRYLIVTQLNRTEISTASFTVRNTSRNAILLCHFVPKRKCYMIRPSATFLLPYPESQEFIIRTQEESPELGDKIALYIYVLQPGHEDKLPKGCDVSAVRQFIERKRQEVLLKCTCDLIVSKIEISNTAHGISDAEAKLFDSDSLPVAAMDACSTAPTTSSDSGSSPLTCVERDDFVDIEEAVAQYDADRGDCTAPVRRHQRIKKARKSKSAKITGDKSECCQTSQSMDTCLEPSAVEITCDVEQTMFSSHENVACSVKETSELAEECDRVPCEINIGTEDNCCENECQTDIPSQECTGMKCALEMWDTGCRTTADACCDAAYPTCDSVVTQTQSSDCFTETPQPEVCFTPAEQCVEEAESEGIEEMSANYLEETFAQQLAEVEPLVYEEKVLHVQGPPEETQPTASPLTNADNQLAPQPAIPNFVKWLALLALLGLLYMLYRSRKLSPVTPVTEWKNPELWSLRPSKRGLKETRPSLTPTKPWLQFWPFYCTQGANCWNGLLSRSFPQAQQCNPLLEPLRSYCADAQNGGMLSYWSCRLAEHIDGEQCHK